MKISFIIYNFESQFIPHFLGSTFEKNMSDQILHLYQQDEEFLLVVQKEKYLHRRRVTSLAWAAWTNKDRNLSAAVKNKSSRLKNIS